MPIPKNKRRYTVTLTPANVDRFQKNCKKLGFPLSTMSLACDEIIKELCSTFETAIEKGTLQLSDLFKLMGKQMEFIEDEKEVVKNDQTETTVRTKKAGKL